MHGIRAGTVVRVTFWQSDTAAGQEVTHPVRAGFAVHVQGVISRWVKRDKRLARLLGPLPQERVEHLRPRLVVYRRGVGQHPVQIEQAPPLPPRATPGCPLPPVQHRSPALRPRLCLPPQSEMLTPPISIAAEPLRRIP